MCIPAIRSNRQQESVLVSYYNLKYQNLTMIFGIQLI